MALSVPIARLEQLLAARNSAGELLHSVGIGDGGNEVCVCVYVCVCAPPPHMPHHCLSRACAPVSVCVSVSVPCQCVGVLLSPSLCLSLSPSVPLCLSPFLTIVLSACLSLPPSSSLWNSSHSQWVKKIVQKKRNQQIIDWKKSQVMTNVRKLLK